jgi:hypothetical protein
VLWGNWNLITIEAEHKQADRARKARNQGVVVMTIVKSEIEGEIRQFVRRDAASLRRNPETDSDSVSQQNVSSLLQRVAGTSVHEIDRLITELQTLREMLSAEGARVQREIEKYATLSHSAMQSTKIIVESLSQLATKPRH